MSTLSVMNIHVVLTAFVKLNALTKSERELTSFEYASMEKKKLWKKEEKVWRKRGFKLLIRRLKSYCFQIIFPFPHVTHANN